MTEKIIVEATIPTVQYGNVKPTIEIEGDDWDTIRDQALTRIKEISDMTAGEGYSFEVRGLPISGTPTQLSTPSVARELRSLLTGVTVLYDKVAHKYTTKAGQTYLSGSKFPDRFYAPFDAQMILEKMVAKYPGVTASEIQAMWKLNNEASTGYGTAIHAALENYFKNRKLGATVQSDTDGPNKALSKNPFLKHVVESFVSIYSGGDVLSEVFVANEEFRVCGYVDLVQVIDKEKKIVRIQDYKTDGNIHEKKYQVKDSPFKGKIDNTLLGLHWLQLSFYAWILQRAGYTVEGLDVFWLNPNKLVIGENPWEIFSHDVVDVTEGIIGK